MPIEKKQTLVLLHGWGCDSSTWLPLLEQLQTFTQVITVDLPGFGKNSTLDAVNLEDASLEKGSLENVSLENIIEFIIAQLPESCALMGWSLGGMLAVQIAARYPQKITHIITLAANAKFVVSRDYPCAMPLEINRQFTKNFATDPQATLKIFNGLLAQGDANERALLKKMRAIPAPVAINNNWLQALQLLTTLDNREAFSSLIQPGLHLLGEADALVPASAASILAALNSQQEIHILPKTAHAIHWSNPMAVMQLITTFLQLNAFNLHSMEPSTRSATFTRRDAGEEPAGMYSRRVAERVLGSMPTRPIENISIENNSIEKKHIAQSFSRAAHSYDAVAKLQCDVSDKLLQLLSPNHTLETVIDLGCGTGYASKSLQQKFPQANIIGIDLAEGMLAVAQQKNAMINTWLCGDAEMLPLANNSVDIIFSSLALQWCQNLPALFAELQRVLKPCGKIFFATLGPNTLHELKRAWQKADHYVHVNQFETLQNIKDALLNNHLSMLMCEEKTIVLEFEKLSDLTRELKALGAHNINAGRATGLTGRKKIMALKAAYEHFRRENLLPATYDIFYIAAEKNE